MSHYILVLRTWNHNQCLSLNPHIENRDQCSPDCSTLATWQMESVARKFFSSCKAAFGLSMEIYHLKSFKCNFRRAVVQLLRSFLFLEKDCGSSVVT